MQDAIDHLPLISAAHQGSLGVVENLIVNGADVNEGDASGRTALHWAAIEGHRDVVQLLILKGANLNAQDYQNRTPLSLVSPTENVPMIDLLIAGGAVVDLKVASPKMDFTSMVGGVKDQGSQRPLEVPAGVTLHQSARLGRVELIELLVGAGRNVNQKDPNRAPLHWAVIGNKREAVRALLAAGADINVQDKWSRTPLWIAAAAGLHALVDILLAHGADPNACDYHGCRVLHVAVDENWGRKHDNRLVVKSLVEHMDIKIDIGEIETGRTALHIATCTGNMEVVKVLVNAGADPERRDNRGLTPLELARADMLNGSM